MGDELSPSEQRSSKFYSQLGVDGLSDLTEPERDLQIVSELEKSLSAGRQVLDLCCGYGRIAVPLAASGHHVLGIDLSPTLLEGAAELATREEVSLRLARGTMRRIPLASSSVDVVLCLWTAFNEMLTMPDQLSVINEVWRVLVPGGWALFEGPLLTAPTDEEIACGIRHGHEYRIMRVDVSGFHVHIYLHDARSLGDLMKKTGMRSYKAYVGPWAGRQRQFLRFEKDAR